MQPGNLPQASVDQTSSGSAYTAGPWTYLESGFGETFYIVCLDVPGRLQQVCVFEPGSPNAEANARVVATAPEVLEAARAFVAAEDALLAELRAANKLPDLTEQPWTLVDALRAAVAKATGTANAARPEPATGDGSRDDQNPSSPNLHNQEA